MEELRKFVDYKQFKGEFDREIGRQAEGFVKMGYLLKVARDTDILYESGYKSISEFAWEEYKLTEDTVSRMIAVNDRYSEGGYSDRLAERYRGFGSSLLADMLTLSDKVIDALPKGIKRQEIREIKSEIREEQKITDLEVLMERRERDAKNNLCQMLHRYYYENRREYPNLHQVLMAGKLNTDTAMDILAPNGSTVKFARVPGHGRFMLSVKGKDQDIELLNVRSNEWESYSWEECLEALQSLFCGLEEAEKDWEALYGETYSEYGEKVAPAQKEDESEKRVADSDKRKESAKAEGGKSQKNDHRKKREPIQQNIENYPEALPKGYIKCHDGSEVETEGNRLWKEASEYAGRIYHALDDMDYPVDDHVLKEMQEVAEKLLEVLKQIKVVKITESLMGSKE